MRSRLSATRLECFSRSAKAVGSIGGIALEAKELREEDWLMVEGLLAPFNIGEKIESKKYNRIFVIFFCHFAIRCI